METLSPKALAFLNKVQAEVCKCSPQRPSASILLRRCCVHILENVVLPDLNNVVEQDHRRVKGRLRPMLGFKTFDNARRVIIGIELAQKIHKRQFGISIPWQSNPAVIWRHVMAASPRCTPDLIAPTVLSAPDPPPSGTFSIRHGVRPIVRQKLGICLSEAIGDPFQSCGECEISRSGHAGSIGALPG